MNKSTQHDDGSHELETMILEHISEQISRMKPGEKTDCESLFDPKVWQDFSAPERRNPFGRIVSRLGGREEVHPVDPDRVHGGAVHTAPEGAHPWLVTPK